MDLPNTSPNIARSFWSRIGNTRWGSSFRRFWQWVSFVQTDDPVRLVLNKGFSIIISVLTLVAVMLAFAQAFGGGRAIEVMVLLVMIPFLVLAWYVNRRGTVYGAILLVVLATLGNAVGTAPEQYAGEHPLIPVGFIIAPLVAAIFVRPSAGLLAAVGQISAMVAALVLHNIPGDQIQTFLGVGVPNMLAPVIFAIVGANLFTNALRSSIAANTALQQLNGELEQRVADRTADLEEANTSLLEAKQTADRARNAAEEANNYKTRFLANMSHELRTPLNAIINFAHFLADTEYGDVTEQQRVFQSRILYNGEHLLGLINDILDLSKIEAGKMDLACEKTDLEPLFHGVMSTAIGLTKDKGLDLMLEADEDLPPVWIDKTRIRQVLLNLLSNAAKFTDQGGITVRARATGDGFVQISVQDTGIGIAAEHQGRVFDEFQQVQDDLNRSHQGTGLGLPISKRLIEMHGGHMALESAPGVGSIFSFTIPVAQSTRTPGVENLENGARAETDAPLITVIDDDVDSQRILRTMLQSAGYQVQGIMDSQVALEELRRRPPSLVILDLKMEPIDGWSLLGMIHDDPFLAALPVVICSVVDPVNAQVSVLNNVTAYLPKPVRQEDVLSLVRQFTPSGTVMVVDDDIDARRVLKNMLDKLGHKVIEAPNGSTALALIPEAHPDLILLDLMMPGMDGFEVLEHLQDMPSVANVPVVVVTAKDLDAEERAWLRERTRHCFQKPAPAPTFLSVVRNVLKGVTNAQPSA